MNDFEAMKAVEKASEKLAEFATRKKVTFEQAEKCSLKCCIKLANEELKYASASVREALQILSLACINDNVEDFLCMYQTSWISIEKMLKDVCEAKIAIEQACNSLQILDLDD